MTLTIVCMCVVSSSVEVFIRNKYEKKLYIAKGEQPKKPEQDRSKVGVGKTTIIKRENHVKCLGRGGAYYFGL